MEVSAAMGRDGIDGCFEKKARELAKGRERGKEGRQKTYLKTSSHTAIVVNARKKGPKMQLAMSVRREGWEREERKKGRESGVYEL